MDGISRYRTRSIVVLAIFVAATSVLSSVLFLKAGLEKEAELAVLAGPDITMQYLQGGRLLPIPTYYLENVTSISMMAGITKVTPRIWGYAGIGSYTYVVMGIDLTNANEPRGIMASIERGRLLQDNDAGSGNVVLGRLLTHVLRVDVGDRLVIVDESMRPNYFTVVGVFSDYESLYTADIILMSIEDARRFFRIPEGHVTDIAIYLLPGFSTDLAARLLSDLPNVRVMSSDLLLRALKVSYSARGGFFASTWTVLLLAMGLAAFSQATIVGHESRFEIGLLKAFGFSTYDVIEVRLLEAAILGFLSASLGMLIGAFYAWLNAPGLIDALLGWAYIPSGFHLPIYIKLEDVLTIYSITSVTLLVATTVPAWINSTVDPEISMRRATA